MGKIIAATSENEDERLKALHALEILDTEHEPEFDELVCLASAICETPISLVSLIDKDRQWFKAQIGLEITETPRAIAFCSQAIQQPDLFLVEDAQKDERFSQNPFVRNDPWIRFYAGMPVTSPEGHAVGTLCVIDSKPKTLTQSQMTALKILATQVNARLELRIQRRKLEKSLQETEETRHKLHESEERFRLFMDHSPILSYIKDETGRIIFYNRIFAERFGIDRKEWIGKTSFDLWPEEEAEVIHESDMDVIHGSTFENLRQSVHDKDGKQSWWRSYKFPLQSSGGLKLMGGASVEITDDLAREEALEGSRHELETANLRLQNLVVKDALTGLYNRRGFDERLNADFSRAHRKETDLSVLLLDLDNFKQRNDTYGHPEGDETLRQLAVIMQKTVRLGDLAARYGGEEFAILLPETNEAQAMQFAMRLLEAIRGHQWAHESVTASMGIASLHPSTPTQQQLIALADEALYIAKRFGKNRAVSYGDYFKQMLKATPKQEAKAKSVEIEVIAAEEAR